MTEGEQNNSKDISILDQIKLVAGLRLKVKQHSELKTQMLNEWQKANEQLFNEWGMIAHTLNEAETKLRELTIKAYNETGSKNPAPGVGIREITKLEYNPKQAFEWAKEHQIALSLDKKSFESLAKANPIDFVTISTEPQATIATDLLKALEAK